MTATIAIVFALLGLALGFGLGWFLSRRAFDQRLREQARSLEAAQREARTDTLTGLANRKGFDEHLELFSAIARRYKSGLALALFDLDGLKQINDRHGHAAGDAALAHFASILRSSSRESDFISRIGGDEFAILLPQTGSEGAGAVARRISQALAESRAPTPFLASVGIAVFQAGQSPAQFLECADRALYGAKHAGGTRPPALAAETPGDQRSSDSSTR
jgi:diguanylate cyclase (GGDEF)-like protein